MGWFPFSLIPSTLTGIFHNVERSEIVECTLIRSRELLGDLFTLVIIVFVVLFLKTNSTCLQRLLLLFVMKRDIHRRTLGDVERANGMARRMRGDLTTAAMVVVVAMMVVVVQPISVTAEDDSWHGFNETNLSGVVAFGLYDVDIMMML